jgi:hypothetical protein
MSQNQKKNTTKPFDNSDFKKSLGLGKQVIKKEKK